ncbi:MAG: pyridoxal-phosphate dependent enzyme [Verrucomicrobia bacterium]|nr:pyridoxal-phosphate dependent enzyme [Verrucomicrobiota bacterium]
MRNAPLLFEMSLRLREQLPWLPLVDAPTPVARLAGLSERLGVEVWIKRDDLTSPVYGGNKPRKLEFLLAAARAGGFSTVVTLGGLGTNHGLATAIHGRRLGLRVVLGLFEQPVTDHVRRSLRLYHAHGAEMIYAGSGIEAIRRFEDEHAARADAARGNAARGNAARGNAYSIPMGGSNAVGALGFVDAGLELARQVEQGNCPMPRAVYVATGTCGTLAGLCVGLKLGGLATRVVGLQVTAPVFANAQAALGLAAATLSHLRSLDASLPPVELSLDDFVLDTGHFGPGYGHPTDSARAAIGVVRETEGLTLDLTYTGKALGALIDHVRAGTLDGPVLFWNTFNSVELSAAAERVDWHDLPQAFHRFFE